MTVEPLAVWPDLADWQQGQVDPVAAAAAVVRGYCGWHVAPTTTETIVLDGTAGRVLALPTKHLLAVTGLSVDGETVPVVADEVEWSRSGILYRRAGWGRRLRGVTLTITHGYPEVPADLRDAVLDMASSGGQGSRVSRMQVGQVSQTFTEEALPLSQQAVLDRYRLTAVG